jgi:hypothetical protein
MDWRLEPLILPFLLATLLLLALPKAGHPHAFAPGGAEVFRIASRTLLADTMRPARAAGVAPGGAEVFGIASRTSLAGAMRSARAAGAKATASHTQQQTVSPSQGEDHV